MPHSLVLIFGDTVKAAEAFDRHMPPEVARACVLVDTFHDEAEEALRVAHALGDRLYGVRLDTAVRARPGDARAGPRGPRPARPQEGYGHVKITVSGGLNPDRIRFFKEEGAAGRTRTQSARTSPRQADRFHRRSQGDRRQAVAQARPDPGPDSQSAPAKAGYCRVALERSVIEGAWRVIGQGASSVSALAGMNPEEREQLDELAERESAYGLFQRAPRPAQAPSPRPGCRAARAR